MKKIIISILLLGLVLTPAYAQASIWGGGGEKGLPKTGQTTEYQSGDDGTYMKGLPSAGDRFTDLGTGVIQDNVTGLQWVKQPELIIPGAIGVHSSNQVQVAKGTWVAETVYAAADLIYDDIGALYYVCAVGHTAGSVDFATDIAAHPTYWRQTVWTGSADGLTTPVYMDWSTAITSCEALNYAGHDDWRLPNIKELMSIVDYGTYSPAANAVFVNCQSDVYWSGTTCAYNSDVAWFVGFYGGYVFNDVEGNSFYVRPVRSGQ